MPQLHSDIPPTVFNPVQFMENIMNDTDLAETLIGIFLEDMPVRLEALHAALTASDLVAVELQAHAIKGSAFTMGAQDMAMAALAVETAARGDDAAASARTMSELRAAFELTRGEIEKLLKCGGEKPFHPTSYR